MSVDFSLLVPTNHELINLISNWYNKEWSIPLEATEKSFVEMPDNHVILQIVMIQDGTPIGTGGIYKRVGIQDKVKKYINYEPWLALMYTIPEVRSKGLGSLLLAEIEKEARKHSLEKIYLFTHTAKSLYAKNSWGVIEEFAVSDRTITVMEKNFHPLIR